MVLKAELHCHIEGAAAPELVIEQARKYGKDVSRLHSGTAPSSGTISPRFLAAYDFASDLFRTEEDYARLAEHYLTSLARDGCIYSEFFTSPDHAEKSGLSPAAYTHALGEGMLRAKAKTGIEGRMIVTGVRHFGVEAIEAAARFAARCGHPLVTGFGVAGDERHRRFRRLCARLRDRARGGPRHHHPCRRVRRLGERQGRARPHPAVAHRPWRACHREPDLVKRIADEGVVLECCPGSNVALGRFRRALPTIRFRRCKAAGCKVTLNSDDPPYFWTVAEARIRHRAAAFRPGREGADGDHQDRDRSRLRRPQDPQALLAEAARRRRALKLGLQAQRFLAAAAARLAISRQEHDPCRASPSSTTRSSSTSSPSCATRKPRRPASDGCCARSRCCSATR